MGVVSPRLILVTGPPGTGKSAIAEQLARDLGAPSFAWDWLMGALTRFGFLGKLARDRYVAVGYDLMTMLAGRQLSFGQSVVLDCLARSEQRDVWRALAADYRSEMFVIETSCSDIETHRSRVEGRIRGIPGWHELDWAYVARARQDWPGVEEDHLTLDAVDPLAENLARARNYVGLER